MNSSSDAPNLAARGHIAGNPMSMHQLAALISRFERETVVDETGLAALYQFKLDWSSETSPDSVPSSNAATFPSLSTALQEQLGLKLQAVTGPLDVLVIDRAERVPAEN
jgi:uncharacterized protein (TIGR03435 family)